MEFHVDDVFYLEDLGLVAFEIQLPSPEDVVVPGLYEIVIGSIPRGKVWIDGEAHLGSRGHGKSRVVSTKDITEVRQHRFQKGRWRLILIDRANPGI